MHFALNLLTARLCGRWLAERAFKLWKMCSRIYYSLLCFGFYFLLKQSPITIWRSHQMSDYDWIIEKFILKSKTKWVDGLQFVPYRILLQIKLWMAELHAVNMLYLYHHIVHTVKTLYSSYNWDSYTLRNKVWVALAVSLYERVHTLSLVFFMISCSTSHL